MGRFEIAVGSATGLSKKTGITLEQEVWFLLQAHMKALEGVGEDSQSKAEGMFMDGVRRMQALGAISEQALRMVDLILHGGVAPKKKKKKARTDYDNCRGTPPEAPEDDAGTSEMEEFFDELGGGCGSGRDSGSCGSGPDRDRRC